MVSQSASVRKFAAMLATAGQGPMWVSLNPLRRFGFATGPVHPPYRAVSEASEEIRE